MPRFEYALNKVHPWNIKRGQFTEWTTKELVAYSLPAVRRSEFPILTYLLLEQLASGRVIEK